MDYVRVCLGVLPILLALCHPAHGACRCRDQSECDLPKKYCEAGCETGFTGSRCQYVNQLAYASCKVHQDVVDENLSTCTSQGYTGYITCSIEGPPREFNIIRIFHEPSKSLPSFYIATRGEWEQVSIHKNVTNKITDYEYKGKRLNSSLILHPKFRVCEVAVAYECLHDDECNMECNCKNASDCLGNPRRCPSGCAVGYTGKNYGCEKIEVTPASTLEHETSTAGETTSPPVEPTNACSSGYYRDGQACTPCGAGCTSPCNAANGNCTCKLGWTGNSCNNCEDGYYMDKRDSYMDRRDCVECGAGCESGTCEDETGHCSCRSGWKVPRCATRCVRYRYGIDCKQTCSYGCNSRECNSSTGECLTRSCKPGWRSTDSRRRCDQECPDGSFGVNCDSKCSAGCRVSSCNRKTGRCSCKHGWTPGSSNRCDRCARDKYGIDCQQTCSSGCKSGGCNSSTGECLGGSCKPGWMNTDSLQRCDQECPDGSHGVNCVSTCSPGCLVSPCDRITGRCKYDGGYCKRGWTSWYSHPYRCDRCNGGYYGDGQDCTQCGAGCNGVCDGNDGHCKCKTGWTGTRCNKCEDGYYMDRRDCVECGAGCEPGTCNANNGLCTCVSGWKGPRCATRCDVGTYGPGCTGKCNAGCKPGSCNHVTVDCKCKDGWRGPRCEHICPEETYGRDCTGECNAGCKPLSCHHITGDCNNQCEDGWTGPSCEHKCIDGTYGLYCTEECNTGCKPWSCNHITGDCNNQCEDGWTGRRCEHKCIDGTYGRNCTGECNEGCKPGSCRHDTGDCNSQCKDGWTGASCEHKCGKGQYGSGCRKPCRRECLSCHHVTGSCASNCVSGWHGENCTSRCRSGIYGQDCRYQCHEGCQPEKCDSINGSCGTSCRAGWTGENCVDVCSPGAHGENCVLNCSRGCVNQTCDRTTGRCDMCLDGWEHKDQNTSRCDKECDDGMFGEQCNDECSIHCVNATCHHVNGSCTHGCFDGRSGEYCEVSEAGHQNVNLIVGLVLFLIAVIAVAMCAVVYFREPLRRLRGKKTGEDMTNGLSFPMAAREGQGASENGAVYDDDEAIYINVPSSVPVAVSDLKDFVAKKKATKEILVKEYAELPKGLTAIHDKALTQVNSPKNRFKGIYPYNPSLVVLKGPSGSSGYINASFIDGPTRGKKYIATQGPLPHTVVDFLEMIWQQNVPVIVMLANIIEDGRRRCEPYWPNEPGEDSKTFGPWKITVADSCPLADFTIRTLKMRKGAVEKTVKHVHYMVWPDKDVPDNTMSLVDLRNKVRTFCDFAEGPMVVHCSAGVGRTGTLIALDSLIEDAETRSKVDIYGCVWRLRNFRVSMVQTQSQYVFLHDCILDALCHTVHPTPASFYDNAYKQLKGGSGIAVAYQKLSECPVTDHLSDAARDLENINKNRSEDILPGDKHRAILSTHIAGGNDYINAVIAPSYEKREAFILTQIPLTSTVVDFWRLVHDYDIRGIVLLENYTDLDAKCGVFWAKDKKPAKFGPFTVSEGKTEKQTGFTMEKISYSLGTEEKDVTVFRSSAWPQKSSLPESPSSLLSLIDFLRQWNTGTSPLLVVCSDGATRSGLFCVVASAVQRLLLEKEVALPQTIRIIRFFRKQVIPNREQFEFCFDSVKVYMDSFQEYSNFA